MQRYVVGIGEILWDMLPKGKMLGGAPANFAFHASRQGQNAIVVSAVGNDVLGNEILSFLESHDINHKTQVNDHPTGVVNVTLDASGIPSYNIVENTAWDNIAFTPQLAQIASQCSAVCFGSLAQRSAKSRQTIIEFLKATPGDCLRVFDINLRQHFFTREIIEQSLNLCNILKLNDEELIAITSMLSLGNNPCHELMQHYHIDTVIVTCGAYGSYVHTTDGTSFLPTPRVKVVDTVGAGDAFTATYIASILNGDNITTAHQKAVDCAAYICTHAGAIN